MTTMKDRLQAFRTAAEIPSPDSPTIPPTKELKLALRILTEEFCEVYEKFYPRTGARLKDLALTVIDDESVTPCIPPVYEVAHELGDVAYVTENFFKSIGVDSEPVHDEIQRANLDKAKGPRRADGKVLKPEGWRPADIKSVIEKQIDESLIIAPVSGVEHFSRAQVHGFYADGLL